MNYKLILTKHAKKDLDALDKSIAIEVIKKLEKLLANPLLGKPLGNKLEMNLTGYYKLYACKKKIRIIYTISKEKLIIEVIGIGKRANEKIYKEIMKRLLH